MTHKVHWVLKLDTVISMEKAGNQRKSEIRVSTTEIKCEMVYKMYSSRNSDFLAMLTGDYTILFLYHFESQ